MGEAWSPCPAIDTAFVEDSGFTNLESTGFDGKTTHTGSRSGVSIARYEVLTVLNPSES